MGKNLEVNAGKLRVVVSFRPFLQRSSYRFRAQRVSLIMAFFGYPSTRSVGERLVGACRCRGRCHEQRDGERQAGPSRGGLFNRGCGDKKPLLGPLSGISQRDSSSESCHRGSPRQEEIRPMPFNLNLPISTTYPDTSPLPVAPVPSRLVGVGGWRTSQSNAGRYGLGRKNQRRF